MLRHSNDQLSSEVLNAYSCLEESLKTGGKPSTMAEAHRMLAQLYSTLGDSERAAYHTEQFEVLAQP